MSDDVAAAIVAEAERIAREEEDARAVRLRITFVSDNGCDSLQEDVTVMPDGDGVQATFRTLRWTGLSTRAQLCALVQSIAVTLFSQAAGGGVGNRVDNAFLQVLHRGQTVLWVSWPRCDELDVDEVQTGSPEARELLDFMWRYALLGVTGAGMLV